MERDLTLREALAEDRLDDFVRQEEEQGGADWLKPATGLLWGSETIADTVLTQKASSGGFFAKAE